MFKKAKKMGMRQSMLVVALAAVVALAGLAGCSSNTAASGSAASSSSNDTTSTSQTSADSSAAASSAASSSADSKDAASDDASQANQRIVANLVVNGEAGDKVVQFVGEVDVPAESTVLDALKSSDLDLVIEDSSYGPFVQSIDGLANEGSSGWTYTVNGQQVQSSADTQPLLEGDLVEWTYVTY